MKYFSKPWFVAICFIILMKPGCVSGMDVLAPLDALLNLLRILLVLYALMVFGKSMLVLPINQLLLAFLLVGASILWEPIATILNGKSVADIGSLVNNLGIALVSYMALRVSYDAFIKALAKVSGTYVILNFLSVVLFPGGMYATEKYTQNYFLSYRTAWLTAYLLALTTVLLWNENAHTHASKRFSAAVIIAAAVSMVMQWTATGLFCFTLAGCVLAVYTYRKRRSIKIQWLILIEAIVFWIVVIARLMDMFSFLLVNVLKKDLTLTFRTRIWDNALNSIQKNFLFGVGRLSTEQMRQYLGFGASHPHNNYLAVLMCFGIVGLTLLILTIYCSNKGFFIKGREQEGRIMMAAYIVMLTAAQVETFFATGGYLIPLYLISAALHCKVGRRKEFDKNDWISNTVSYE